MPTIHFGTGTATLLDQLDGDVVGLDWRVPLDEGWDVVGERGVQGNLDPAALLAPWTARGGRLDVSSARAGATDTSSTSATGSCRRRIPTP